LTREHGGEVFYAPFDIVLSEYNVVQPDLIYFGPDLARRIRPMEHVRFPPDVAIEVLSPSTARNDRGRKRDLMARYRVPEYWIVDPDERGIEVFPLASEGYAPPRIITGELLVTAAIPGFRLDVSRLFDEL
jgi:Uma2 family endonuclease